MPIFGFPVLVLLISSLVRLCLITSHLFQFSSCDSSVFLSLSFSRVWCPILFVFHLIPCSPSWSVIIQVIDWTPCSLLPAERILSKLINIYYFFIRYIIKHLHAQIKHTNNVYTNTKRCMKYRQLYKTTIINKMKINFLYTNKYNYA